MGNYTFGNEELTGDVPYGDFDCVFALRPEHITLLDRPEDGAVDATVYADQPAGSETLVTLVRENDEFLAKLIGIQEYGINQKVYLRLDPGKFNIFHKESQKLIKLDK